MDHHFTRRKLLILLLPSIIFLALRTSPVFGDQRIVEEPEDTIARIGDNVVLRCRVADQKGQVIWMQGDIGLGYKRELPFWERMRMVGSQNEGEYHLEIRNVSLEDEETYQCQLSSTDEEPIAKLSRRAKLTVIVEPQAPVLLGESADTTIQRTQPIGATEGRPVRLSCRSRAGKPVAKLSWALAEDWEAQRLIGHIANATDRTGEGEQQQITTMHPIRAREHLHRLPRPLFGNIVEEIVKDEDTQLYTVTSHLIFTPTKAEDGRWLVCLAAHETYGRESRSASVRMDVFYAPKVRVEMVPEGSQLHEGGHIKLSCVSDARPAEELKLSWSWDGEPNRMELIDSQTVLIKGLRFNDNGRRVTCSVENKIGVGTGVFEMDVPYGPRFMSTNQTKIVERGGQATFQCEVIGNPSPSVRWFHGRDMETPIYEGKNITISNAQDWEEGEYRCEATVDGFPTSTLHHMLFLRGPPKVRLADELEDGDVEGSVALACMVQHRTERVKVHWYHNGRRVDMEPGLQAEERRYHVRDERVSRWELVSRLTILRFTDADFGTYNCSARNEHGVVWDQREISRLGTVDKIRRFARQLPLEAKMGAGAAALLLTLIALITCCCCICRCRRRRSGHSKLSNISSSKEFNGSVRVDHVEELFPNHNCSTPLYSAHHQFNSCSDQETYLCEPLQEPCQFNIPAGSTIAQYPTPEYSPNGMVQQQYNGANTLLPMNGHLAGNDGHNNTFNSAGYQPYHGNGGMGGGGSTFVAHQRNGSNTMIVDHQPQNPSMNSFGMAPSPVSYSSHQPQQYYTSPTQMETVPEVVTPDSADVSALYSTSTPGMAHHQKNRPLSRDSTLV